MSLDSQSNGKYSMTFGPLHVLTLYSRDSEDSAPPEFPPDQPEADLTADGDQYGAEEEEEEELEEAAEGVEGEDADMAGAEDTAGPQADDAVSEAGSEDIDIESSEDEDEEEEVEGEGDDDMEMDDADDKTGEANGQQQKDPAAATADVMVH